MVKISTAESRCYFYFTYFKINIFALPFKTIQFFFLFFNFFKGCKGSIEKIQQNSISGNILSQIISCYILLTSNFYHIRSNSCVPTWFCKLHTVIFTERQATASYIFFKKYRKFSQWSNVICFSLCFPGWREREC